jgi:hypothetical protein
MQNEIAEVFKDAGANPVDGSPNMFPYNVEFGVLLSLHLEVNTAFIVATFLKAGVIFSVGAHDPLWMAPRRPAPNVRIFVGPKPPPSFSMIRYAATENDNNASSKRE